MICVLIPYPKQSDENNVAHALLDLLSDFMPC